MKALFIIRQIKLAKKKEYTTAIFYLDYKTFVIYVTSIASLNLIYPLHKAQTAPLKTDEACIAIWSKYANFVKFLFLVLTVELSLYIRINNHTIKLINGKQLLY